MYFSKFEQKIKVHWPAVKEVGPIEIKLRPPIKHLDGVLAAGIVHGDGKHAMNFSGHSLNTSNGFKRCSVMCGK